MLRRERFFALAALTAAFGFAASLPILDVDAFIVRQNLARETVNEDLGPSGCGCASLDSDYFLDLSDDAIPALVTAYRSPTLTDPVQDKVGAALACIRRARVLERRPADWRSFHLSVFRADQALAGIDAELDQYMLVGNRWNYAVETPLGEEVSCSTYYSYDR
jgi:hypothetical protein